MSPRPRSELTFGSRSAPLNPAVCAAMPMAARVTRARLPSASRISFGVVRLAFNAVSLMIAMRPVWRRDAVVTTDNRRTEPVRRPYDLHGRLHRLPAGDASTSVRGGSQSVTYEGQPG